MEKITVNAYAKINLSLNITGTENDMHKLDMVMASIDICDIITIKKRKDKKIKFSCSKLLNQNTATNAAELFVKVFDTQGVDIKIKKLIPFSAGVGGSSADGAGVLCGLCSMFEKDIDDPLVLNIAKKIGSDVTYMLKGGFMRVSGTGEIVQPINSKRNFKLLLVKPKEGVSTKQCYERFDNRPNKKCADNDAIVSALENGDLALMGANMQNMLEGSAKVINRDIAKILAIAQSFNPIKAMLTGSGSAITVIFDDDAKLAECEKTMHDCGLFSKVVNTLSSGVQLIY